MTDSPVTDLKHPSLRGLALLVSSGFRVSPALAIACLALLPITGAYMQISGVLVKLVADAIWRQDARLAVLAVIAVAVSAGMMIVAGVGGSKLRLTLTEKVSFDLERRLTEITGGLPGLEHHERPEYLDKQQLLRSQQNAVGMGLNAILNMLTVLVPLGLTVALLVRLHPALLLVPVSGVPIAMLTVVVQRRTKRVEERAAHLERLSHGLFALSTKADAAREMRVFNLTDEVGRRYDDAWARAYKMRQRLQWTNTLIGGAGWIVPPVAVVAAVAFVALRAARGLATPGDVLLAGTLAGTVTFNIGGIIFVLGWTLQSLRVAGRLVWLQDYAAAFRRSLPTPVPAPVAIRKGIEMRGVSFRYPGTGTDVLTGVNLAIPAGGVVAFVGANGAGKSTLVKLLCRFYDPTSGEILVDSTSLRMFDHEEWRERIAAGFQDFCRFEVLAREAVGVGDLPRVEDPVAVGAALARAGGSDVANILPRGLETQLGRQWDGGEELSIGQWQKLALGRALMREDPLLLILDEPTSALDAETEHALFERFAEASRRATHGGVTALVSHRFSTVRMADLIVVVDGGRIVESGSHGELMASGGLYAELYDLQARAYR